VITNTRISRQLEWEAYGLTDVGKVRSINEDAYMQNDEEAHWVVADGMGGHEAGDVASQSIVEGLGRLSQSAVLAHFVDEIDDCLRGVNEYLVKLAGDDHNKVIGSTVVGLALHAKHAVYYWVGDSRAYLMRNGRLTQLSTDHTHIEEMIQQGIIDKSQAGSHPEKNVITRAVGADYEVFVDFDVEPVQDNDIFMICSDGVEKRLSDEEVEKIFNKHGDDVAEAAQEIVDVVLQRGSPDNVTVVAVRVHELETMTS